MMVLLNKVCLRYLTERYVILRFIEVNAVTFITESLAKKTLKFIWQDLFPSLHVGWHSRYFIVH